MLTGAVSPSGKALARAMAQPVPSRRSTWPVLELGPGTGVVTAALIAHGVAPERIVAVEFNPDFCALLVERYPRLNVVEGDAYDLAHDAAAGLDAALRRGGLEPAAAHCGRRRPRAALDRATRSTGRCPAARFIQFSYGLGPPVAAVPGRVQRRRAAAWCSPTCRRRRSGSIAGPPARACAR